jgi:hypothetical protein
VCLGAVPWGFSGAGGDSDQRRDRLRAAGHVARLKGPPGGVGGGTEGATLVLC